MARTLDLMGRLLRWRQISKSTTVSKEARDREFMPRYKRPLHVVVLALLILLLFYSGLLAYGAWDADAPRSVAGAITILLSCAAVGALLGFIFAIPKRVEVAIFKAGDQSGEPTQEGTATVRPTSGDSSYRPNTSLEEISDWLTKIIVGLGLVEARSIGAFVEEQGSAMAPVLFGTGAEPILGSAALVAGSVLTFLASFLYFRLYLAEEFTRSDQEALRAQSGREEAKDKGRFQVRGPRRALRAITQGFGVPLATSPPPPPPPSPRGKGRSAGSAAAAGESLQAIIESKLTSMREQPLDPADPAKGRFGGSAITNKPGLRELKASVEPDPGDAEWFRITLELTSEAPPLTGDAVFFYHPTFQKPFERVPIIGGQARVHLYAYGAFTVGVLADEGKTELELDLADLEAAPRAFREA